MLEDVGEQNEAEPRDESLLQVGSMLEKVLDSFQADGAHERLGHKVEDGGGFEDGNVCGENVPKKNRAPPSTSPPPTSAAHGQTASIGPVANTFSIMLPVSSLSGQEYFRKEWLYDHEPNVEVRGDRTCDMRQLEWMCTCGCTTCVSI